MAVTAGWPVALALVVLLTSASSSWALAPANDDYLTSESLNGPDGRVLRAFREALVTTEATVQQDLFVPDRLGLPLGGGGAEPTRCRASRYAATVWYDFTPEVAGRVTILAAGYDTAVAVYEYDAASSQLTRMLACQDRPSFGEDLLIPAVRAGRNYTVQVGGAASARGALEFTFRFLTDRDLDGVVDATPDRCPTQRGVGEFGGCPPELRASPRVTWIATPSGIRLRSLSVQTVTPGVRVLARCRRCGLRQQVVAKGTAVRLTRFVGRTIAAGAKIEISVSRPRSSTGRYRTGAIGNYFSYRVGRGGLGGRVTRCLKPGSTIPRRHCT